MAESNLPKICILNKADIVKKHDILPLILQLSQKLEGVEFIPISAKTGEGISTLLSVLQDKLPEQPAIFPKHQITDVSEKFMISELVREKIFHLTNQEIPYSIAVEVEHMVERGLEETEISEQENFVEEEGSTAELQENNQAMIDAF